MSKWLHAQTGQNKVGLHSPMPQCHVGFFSWLGNMEGKHQQTSSSRLHPTILTGMGSSHHAYSTPAITMLLLCHNFCHHIWNILVDVNLSHLKWFAFQNISHSMISHINILIFWMKISILTQMYCTLTITIDHISILLVVKLIQEPLDP